MIQKLILENWRSHSHSELEFGKGTNVLVGTMGAGKTSIMDAICFAFFGTFPSLQARKIKLDEVIKNKPTQEQKTKVMLYFQINNEDYIIKREIDLGKGTTVSELRKNDLLIEGPQNQRTTERISKLLKVDYELFSRAVYAEQNNIDYFLQIPKAQRKQKIDELLRISKFENARKNLSTLTNRLNDRIKEKKSREMPQEELNEIPKIEQDVNTKTLQLNEKSTGIERIKQNHSIKQEKHKEISKIKQQYEETDSKIKQMKGKIEYIQKELQEMPSTKKAEQEILTEFEILLKEKEEVKKNQDLKKTLENERERSTAIIKQNQMKIEETTGKLAQLFIPDNLNQIKEQLKNELKHYQQEVNNIQGDIKTKNNQIKEIQETIIELGDKCPTCETGLTPEKRNEITIMKKQRIEKTNQEKEEFLKKIDVMKNEMKKADEKLEQINLEEKKISEKTFLEQSKQKAEEENKEYLLKVNEIENKLKEMKIEKSLDEISERLGTVEKLVKYFKLKKSLIINENQVQDLAQLKSQLNYNPEQERQLFDEIKNNERQIALVEQEKNSLIILINEKKKRLENLIKIKENIEKNKKEVEYLQKTVDSFFTLQNVLNDTQTQLRVEFTDSTNAALKDIWSRIYPYGDYTELRLDIDEAGDYLLKLKTIGDNWINADGITSGGERSSASLALRIAFSLVLTQNLSWLVLDEPTHNLDKQTVSELAITLREHLPEIVDQIFLITHETELEKAASGKLYRLERNKETDESTKIVIESKL